MIRVCDSVGEIWFMEYAKFLECLGYESVVGQARKVVEWGGQQAVRARNKRSLSAFVVLRSRENTM